MFPRSGGWEDQKLSDLACFNALELVYTTYTYINGKDVDFSTLSKTQLDVITYLEN